MEDNEPVEFECSVAENGKLYVLTVKCDKTIPPSVYAACLRAFAEDIDNGEFDLQGAEDVYSN